MSERKQEDPIQGKIVHEYDGILEADNQLPRWWLAVFGATIVFAWGYWFTYETWHFAPGTLEVYLADLEAASSGGEVTDEVLSLLARSDDRVQQGRRTFASNCAACHGARGEGQIGPNLTDGVWIHGGGPVSIYGTVKDGVPTAGMPAWGAVLGDAQVKSVVAYILSIRDTNLPGRAPQGEPYVPGQPAPTDANEQATAVHEGIPGT